MKWSYIDVTDETLIEDRNFSPLWVDEHGDIDMANVLGVAIALWLQ